MQLTKQQFRFLIAACIIVNATGLFSAILEPDGTLYAYIARQMANSGDFINLYNNSDWLDKPHFPFWVTAISFKLLGINSFAYKLPAFIFWLLGMRFTWLLAKKIYGVNTAMLATIFYATALQSVIALFDVRAEHYLTALTIAGI